MRWDSYPLARASCGDEGGSDEVGRREQARAMAFFVLEILPSARRGGALAVPSGAEPRPEEQDQVSRKDDRLTRRCPRILLGLRSVLGRHFPTISLVSGSRPVCAQQQSQTGTDTHTCAHIHTHTHIRTHTHTYTGERERERDSHRQHRHPQQWQSFPSRPLGATLPSPGATGRPTATSSYRFAPRVMHHLRAPGGDEGEAASPLGLPQAARPPSSVLLPAPSRWH